MRTQSIKASFSLFRISTAENLQYRAAAFSGAIMCVFYALIDITIFSVFYKYGSNREMDMSLSLTQMASYMAETDNVAAIWTISRISFQNRKW